MSSSLERPTVKKIFSLIEWFEFERVQWHRAVRHRGLELRSLDPDERVLVFESIAADLERRKQKFASREQQQG
jgi:hypothetical protein